jgi:small subunit ribosomal protein S3Ae
MAKKVEKIIKQKKKKWFNLIAPKQFNEAVIGETPSFEAGSLIGKTINVSLMNITKNMKKQNINVRLKVTDIKDNKANTTLDVYAMNPSSIKRLVRRKKDRIDDSFVVFTKDDVKVRVKPMVLTKSNTNISVLSSIRRFTRAFLYDKIREMTYGEFVEIVVSDKLTRDMKKSLSKIYPTKIVVIRAFNKVYSENIKVDVISDKDKQLLADVLSSKSKSEDEEEAEVVKPKKAKKEESDVPVEQKDSE